VTWLAYLRLGFASAIAVFALRAFPVLCVLCRRTAFDARQKILACGIYGVCAYLALDYSNFDAQLLLLTYVWLAAASLAIYATSLHAARLVLFTLCTSALLVLPSLCFRGNAVVTVLGWESTLGAYSYLAELSPQRRSVGSFWLFLFVNPTLAYPSSGRQVSSAGVHRPGLVRAGKGLAALWVAGTLGSLTPAWSLPGARALALVTRGVALYAAHSGLASLQIGLFRQLGYAVPERYRDPYLSVGPRDFWTRWNTYIGTWVRLYVFDPIARGLSQHNQTRRPWVRHAVFVSAVGGSFLFVGAYHDVYQSLTTQRLSLSMTVWFALNAAVLIVWELVRRGLRWPLRATPSRLPLRAVTIALLVALLAVLP
jgi:hypothetical protein